MTAQEFRLNTTTAATQGAAVFMALIAVLALGLMGFAMGYAKAGRASLATRAERVAMPGVEAARVSLVTSGEGEMSLASIEPAAPVRAPRAEPAIVPVVTPVALDMTPATPIEAVATPQTEPAAAPEPVAAPAPEAV